MFKLTNRLSHKIEFESVNVYYYDRTGRLLRFRYPGEPVTGPQHEHTSNSGAIFQIGPLETSEECLGLPKTSVPERTARIEVEFPELGWRPKGSRELCYWSNPSLVRPERPPGGHPE